ncbi:MAG: DUF4304 domain-containing protein [Alphaproteobacteria bacterium]
MTRLRGIVGSRVAPLLKNAGFKKARYVWNRTRGDFVDVIDLQIGRGGETGNEVFTLNAGVCVPEWVEMIWEKPLAKVVRETDCAVKGRISQIAAGFRKDVRDEWWTIESEADAVTVGDDLITAISDSVLPFLERISSISDVHNLLSNLSNWQSGFPLNHIYIAIAKAKLGDREGADEILRSVIEGNRDSWAKNILRVQKLLAGSK